MTYTREMAFAGAYQHEDGSLCIQNGATRTWYANDDGHALHRTRRICEREHPASLLEQVEAS